MIQFDEIWRMVGYVTKCQLVNVPLVWQWEGIEAIVSYSVKKTGQD